LQQFQDVLRTPQVEGYLVLALPRRNILKLVSIPGRGLRWLGVWLGVFVTGKIRYRRSFVNGMQHHHQPRYCNFNQERWTSSSWSPHEAVSPSSAGNASPHSCFICNPSNVSMASSILIFLNPANITIAQTPMLVISSIPYLLH
jgi:hypothetical protein